MKQLLYAFVIVPLLARTQITQTSFKKAEDFGIHWAEGLTWAQIAAKAKSENKYIFVDCYATWCGPCKLMDKNVYTDVKIGKFADDKLISVKIQFDITGNDPQSARNWHLVADSLNQKYKILGYPTFLFFSPDGEIVHRDLGYKSTEQFIEVLKTALDPQKQYYRLLAEYRLGERDANDMKKLALQTRLSDEKLAMQIAGEYVRIVNKDSLMTKDGMQFMIRFQKNSAIREVLNDYKENYLNKLSEDELLKRNNLDFISNFPFLVNSKDDIFNLFYHYGKKVDSVMGEGFADRIVRNVIRREDIYSVLFIDNNKPVVKKANWRMLRATIAKKYNNYYAESLVSEVQPLFYKQVGDWKSYVSFFEREISKNPPSPGGKKLSVFGDAWGLNTIAWNIFQFCSDKRLLKKALQWSELSIKLNSQNSSSNIQLLDTKANLLYRLGKVQDAIKEEQQVIELDKADAKKNGREKGPLYTTYITTIDKMKQGKPTWPLNKR